MRTKVICLSLELHVNIPLLFVEPTVLLLMLKTMVILFLMIVTTMKQVSLLQKNYPPCLLFHPVSQTSFEVNGGLESMFTSDAGVYFCVGGLRMSCKSIWKYATVAVVGRQ